MLLTRRLARSGGVSSPIRSQNDAPVKPRNLIISFFQTMSETFSIVSTKSCAYNDVH